MKILVLANFGMGLYKFRKELLEELIEQEHEVYISLPNDEYVQKLKELGCKYIETHVDRRGTNPVKDFKLIRSYIDIIKENKPDLVLTYTIKPNIYGGLACRITRTPYITNITGLGTAIENQGIMQRIILKLYKSGLKKSECIFFQNKPNRQFFIDKGVIKSKTKVIPGSGVNLQEYKFEEYPKTDNEIRLLYIGRIMKAKGIDELLQAAREIKKIYSNIEFDLVGFCEEGYLEELKELNNVGIINYHGQQNDVKRFIKQSHATILPSYHEGTSNVLLESAASGRPVLASKVTGCIETFDDGVSGIGFKPRNVESLIVSISKFVEMSYEKKLEMGLSGRKKMKNLYDRQIVVDAYIEEIDNLNEVSKGSKQKSLA